MIIVNVKHTVIENVGVGEREARIASHLVAERHFRYDQISN